MKIIARSLAAFCVFAILAPWGSAQTPPAPPDAQEANLNAYIQMIRQDLKKNKVSILTDLMNLGPDQSARFWPVYNEYDKALTALADERIALIRLYAANYSGLSDEMATKLALGMMDVEARRLDLRKQYFQSISQALTPKDAARWLQIEAQVEKLTDLQILANLPIVE